MLNYAITFFIIAIVAAFLGFSGIAGSAAGIAKILFFVFLVIAVISFLNGRRGVAEALSTQRQLLALLFRLMGEKLTVDAALTLAQELLAVGAEIFPLSTVPQLPQLLVSLSPRGLSLVGRALAVLLAKAAEQTMDGVPAP